MTTWKRLRKELLEDPETRAEYEARKPAFDLASKVIALRTRLDLTQADLAQLAGMSQPEIARIEAGKVSPKWETISRIFDAAGAELELKLRLPGGELVPVA